MTIDAPVPVVPWYTPFGIAVTNFTNSTFTCVWPPFPAEPEPATEAASGGSGVNVWEILRAAA